MTEQPYDNIEKLKLINKITAILAHEIRNPVSSIAGVAQLISSDKDVLNNEEQRKKLIGIIERESERLTNLVEEFLVYSGSEKRKNERFELNTLIQNSCDNIRSNKDFIKKELSLDCKIKHSNFSVQGDFQRLLQSFDNILVNAVQASTNKGKITLNTTELVNGVNIVISDQGAGISQEAKGNIFEPFFTTKEKGTGLGLAIAWNIIRAHNGTIEADNADNGGAIFKIFLAKTNNSEVRNA